MTTIVSLLEELLRLVEELVDNGKKLQESSKQSIAEDEIETLQQRQELLLSEIEQLDKLIASKKHPAFKESVELQKKIQRKLTDFQKINTNFFEHLENRLNIIQFNNPLKD